MLAKSFSKISIRGRCAFGICCLENALEHYGYSLIDWSILLRQLWKITIDQGAKLDDWIYTTEYIPNCLLEFNTYDKRIEDECNVITENEHNILHEIYLRSNSIINNIIEIIYEMGSNEMFGGIPGDSPYTLKQLSNLIEVMENNQISLPSIELFKKHVFDIHTDILDYGYGEPFAGLKLYSKMVK